MSVSDDVETVRRLLTHTRTYKDALEAVRPALERLSGVEYPGANFVAAFTPDAHDATVAIVAACEDLLAAEGDAGRFWYRLQRERRGLSDVEAREAINDWTDDRQRALGLLAAYERVAEVLG